MSKYDKCYVIGLLDSSYAILLKSANKIENLKKLKIWKNWKFEKIENLKKLTFLAKSSCKIKNVCRNKQKFPKNYKMQIFLKALDACHFKFAKLFATF